MKVLKLQEGVYKVTDNQGTWIAVGGCASDNGKWMAYSADNFNGCSLENNWAVQFKTFKQLKEHSNSPASKMFRRLSESFLKRN